MSFRMLCLIFVLFLNAVELKSVEYTISDLMGNESRIEELVTTLLKEQDYEVLNSEFEIEYKPALLLIKVDTNRGRKFLKLHNKGQGVQEYEGGFLLGQYLPVITNECLISSKDFDLIVAPYFETIDQEGGMLFDVINSLDLDNSNALKKFWNCFENMISSVLSLTLSSLEYCIKPVLNDRLYFSRLKNTNEHQQSGRLEEFYTASKIQLPGQAFTWEDFIDKKWVIDGVMYQESLRELIEKAKVTLDPKNCRYISVCHGDWHDMNIHTRNSRSGLEQFVFLDCELSGANCVLGDAMVYLVYTAIQGDYLTPKYYASQFANRPNALEKAKDNFFLKSRKIAIWANDSIIVMDGVANFGTSNIRRLIAQKFVYEYYSPLISACLLAHGEGVSNQIESTLKACFLMRLLAVYNISKMEPMDQAKIFGLIFKVIGTPVSNSSNNETLKNFLENL